MFPIREIEIHEVPVSSLSEVRPAIKKLYVQGSLEALAGKNFAIVGARAASSYGRRAAIQFARDFSNQGYTVISGLARGIDGCAHYGALSGKSPTVAVLGSGLDHIYPREHRGLAEKILEGGGCLLSEYAPSTPPHPFNFPLRNRIIAALSVGVLVVQARERSGSLITAKCALDLGKDVFVLPGAYNDVSFDGGHTLVQDGAKLVRNIGDILAELPLENGNANSWETLFAQKGGSLTLEEIFCATHLPLAMILEEMEQKKAQGSVLELFPQQYSWINNPFAENPSRDAATRR